MTPPVRRLALAPDAAQSLRAAVGEFRARAGDMAAPAVQRALARHAADAVPRARGVLDALRDVVVAGGAVVVSGVPVGDDGVLVALAAGVGVASPEGNGPGRLVHDVVPRAAAGDAGSSSGRGEFFLHTDSASAARPHAYFALACVANPRGGESLIAAAADVAERLRARAPRAQALLADEVFPFALPPSDRALVRRLPVLRVDDGATTVRYRRDLIEAGIRRAGAVSRAHAGALSAFEDVLRDAGVAYRFTLCPGDVLVANNHTLLHGRTAIAPAAARHLKRLKMHAPDAAG